MSPMIKLQSQHAQVVMATPLARRDEEWTSAAMTRHKHKPAHFERRSVLTHRPRHRRPSHTKSEHENQNKSYRNPGFVMIFDPVMTVLGHNSCHNYMTYGVADGTEYEGRLSTDSIKKEESDNGCNHL